MRAQPRQSRSWPRPGTFAASVVQEASQHAANAVAHIVEEVTLSSGSRADLEAAADHLWTLAGHLLDAASSAQKAAQDLKARASRLPHPLVVSRG